MEHFPLQFLPDELLDLIFGTLSYSALCSLTLASRWAYIRAVPYLWKDLQLVDEDSNRFLPYINHDALREPTLLAGHEQVHDQHDETRILKKLFVLATNPYVASKVQTVLHRCYLPTPELFEELPNLRHDDRISFELDPFGGRQHRSTYVRLVLQAVANMVNVHTLKIILGHCGLTQTLIWGFFGPHRKADVPVRKLWLESCCVRSPLYGSIWTPLDFSNVESLRLRRLWFQFLPDLLPPTGGTPTGDEVYRYARSSGRWYSKQLRTPAANYYSAYIETATTELGVPQCLLSTYADALTARTFDEIITSHVPSISFIRFIAQLASQDRQSPNLDHSTLQHNITNSSLERNIKSAYSIRALDSVLRFFKLQPTVDYGEALWPKGNYECTLTSSGLYIHDKHQTDILDREHSPRLEREYLCQSAYLTSLTFDWVIFQAGVVDTGSGGEFLDQSTQVLSRLCRLQFPHLRAFQLRNCVTTKTQLADDVFLLRGSVLPEKKELLDFLEAHTSLECLAWPMNRFFPPTGIATGVAQRVRQVIANLGRTLTDLRVDAMLSGAGEPVTDESILDGGIADRASRRLFITEFAQHMRALTSIKMEGGIARDEKRETARALRQCPLEKLVFIGASFPPTNTWGEAGELLTDVDEGTTTYMPLLQEEDEEMLVSSKSWTPSSVDLDAHFYPRFGRDHEPMLYTLASHFAGTLQQLKFCGYLGSPMLQRPSSSTHPALHHLKHFHALRELVISFWLLTFFDHAPRDEEIIKYWLDMRSPQSTAVAVVPPLVAVPAAGAEVNPIHEAAAHAPQERPDAARWMYENYHPTNLARMIKDFMGPHLSPIAKAQGVRLRASFCLGCVVQDIFDFDVRIGLDSVGEDEVLDFFGPREDSWESERSVEKLAARRWF